MYLPTGTGKILSSVQCSKQIMTFFGFYYPSAKNNGMQNKLTQSEFIHICWSPARVGSEFLVNSSNVLPSNLQHIFFTQK